MRPSTRNGSPIDDANVLFRTHRAAFGATCGSRARRRRGLAQSDSCGRVPTQYVMTLRCRALRHTRSMMRMLSWVFGAGSVMGMETVGEPKYNVVVIGSGFGGTMTALSIGRAFRDRKRGETVHILERGTWWTTPVATVQDIDVRTPEHLRKNGQRAVQYWPSVDHASGLLDILGRCFRRESNPDGLFC